VVSRPRLFGRLRAQARVSVVSAPPGSGKTVLLRSWISRAGLAERAAWVPAGCGERDPQRFCLSVLQALHQTAVGSALVRAVTAALALYRGLARGQMSVVGPVSAVGAAVVPVAPGMALGERPGVLAVAGALVARPPSCSRRPAARCAAGSALACSTAWPSASCSSVSRRPAGTRAYGRWQASRPVRCWSRWSSRSPHASR
jgi:hypothetical protein